MTRVGRLNAIGCAFALALLIGCSSSGNGEESGRPEPSRETVDVVELTIGAIPIANAAPLMLGIEEGFFEEEGLVLDVEFAQGGAAIVPAVVGGGNDIGYGNVVSPLLARIQGLPVSIIANSGTSKADSSSDGNALLVRHNSPYESLADLNGRSVAINTLQNINEIAVRAAADSAGANSSTFDFVELSFPDMLAALESGDVDAVAITEPFRSQALRESGKYRVLAHYFPMVKPHLLVEAYFVNDDFLNENREVVERFRRAINRSNEFAQENIDLARSTITTYTEVTAEDAQEMVLTDWIGGEVDIDSLEVLQDLMLHYGVVNEKLPVTEFVG